MDNMDYVTWYQFKDYDGNQIIIYDFESLPQEIRNSKIYNEIRIPKDDLNYIFRYYNIWFTYLFDKVTLSIKSNDEQISGIKIYQKSLLDNIVYEYLLPTDWIIIKISEQILFDTQEYVDYLKNKYQQIIEKRKQIRNLQMEIEGLINEQTNWKKIQYIIDKMGLVLNQSLSIEDLKQEIEQIL